MAENEYIEKQSIIDAVRKEFDLYYQIPIYPGDKEVQNLIARVNRVVLENPAADVVEVVRCKDCKRWMINTGIADSPNGHCFEHGICTNGHDFCSYGKRKEQDNV